MAEQCHESVNKLEKREGLRATSLVMPKNNKSKTTRLLNPKSSAKPKMFEHSNGLAPNKHIMMEDSSHFLACSKKFLGE